MNSCSVFGHRWVQYDKYYTTTRGIEAVILCDECSLCGTRSKLVGSPLLFWPQRIDFEPPSSDWKPKPAAFVGVSEPVTTLWQSSTEVSAADCHCTHHMNQRARPALTATPEAAQEAQGQ